MYFSPTHLQTSIFPRQEACHSSSKNTKRRWALEYRTVLSISTASSASTPKMKGGVGVEIICSSQEQQACQSASEMREAWALVKNRYSHSKKEPFSLWSISAWLITSWCCGATYIHTLAPPSLRRDRAQ